MEHAIARDRSRGCLLAGAVGDALGAAVEFASLAEIRARLGPAGVTGHLPAYGRDAGAITDDTQMTLFTAEGAIRAYVRSSHRGIVDIPSVVRRAYWRWLATQGERVPDVARAEGVESGWLVEVPGLHARRAPGNTCLAALRDGRLGTIAEPPNGSKGCGAVMRSAPLGLTSLLDDPFDVAAACGATTHGHPSGYLAGGFLASLVGRLVQGEPLDNALDHATAQLVRQPGHEEVLHAIAVARALAAEGSPGPEQVERLGAGWVAEEALAIGVYCALAAPDLPTALLLAVNHSGDSDSTGSIAGNVLGAALGEAAIPPAWLEPLELRDVIERVADDLAEAFFGAGVGGEHEPYDDRVEEWLRRYPGF